MIGMIVSTVVIGGNFLRYFDLDRQTYLFQNADIHGKKAGEKKNEVRFQKEKLSFFLTSLCFIFTFISIYLKFTFGIFHPFSAC